MNAALGTNTRSIIEGYTHRIFNLVDSIMYNAQPSRKLLTNKSKECEENDIKPGIMDTQTHEATACNLPTDRNAFSHANSLVANQFHSSMDLKNNYEGGYSQTTQFCNGDINAMHITNVEISADMDMNNSYHNRTQSTCVAKAYDHDVYRAIAYWTQSNTFLIYHPVPSNNLAFNSRIYDATTNRISVTTLDTPCSYLHNNSWNQYNNVSRQKLAISSNKINSLIHYDDHREDIDWSIWQQILRCYTTMHYQHVLTIQHHSMTGFLTSTADTAGITLIHSQPHYIYLTTAFAIPTRHITIQFKQSYHCVQSAVLNFKSQQLTALMIQHAMLSSSDNSPYY